MSHHNNIYFVLVRPEFLGNIGSTARVMKNFGFKNLRFVCAPKNYKEAEARKMAVAAFDILKGAELFDSLGEALKDINLALGTTSAKQRDLAPTPLAEAVMQAAPLVGENKIAIVFGDERNGLLKDELERCHHITTIETNPDFPALNLSQAVGIAAYELNRQLASTEVLKSGERPLATGAEDDEIFSQLDSLLHTAEFSRTFNRNKVVAELRAFYQRAHPTTREAGLLKGALIRLNSKIKPDSP